MSYECMIRADSISPAGHRLITYEAEAPRIILAEVNTTRMLSRNSASSRAIPVPKKIASVEADPFIPEVFAKNAPGMAAPDALGREQADRAEALWRRGIGYVLEIARGLGEVELHKGLANRWLEPCSWHRMILSATDWENHENLRVNPQAQGEYVTLATRMKNARLASLPREVDCGEWHLPLVRGIDEWELMDTASRPHMPHISAGRCARVSYLTHDGKRSPQKDIELCGKLITDCHMSPLEHPARPMTPEELKLFRRPNLVWNEGRGKWEQDEARPFTYYCGNFEGWIQLRKTIPGENIFRPKAGA